MTYEPDDFFDEDDEEDFDFELDAYTEQVELPFADALAKLLTDEEVPLAQLYRLSDMSEEERSRVFEAWLLTPVERRRTITRHLADLSEDNFLVDFAPVLAFALEDPDTAVREAALDGLWDTTDLTLVDPILGLLHDDPEEAVRANAAATLSHFILMAAWGELRDTPTERIVEGLLSAYQREGAGMRERRAALEALGSVPEERVQQLIEAAYEGPASELQQGALFAMGNSADPRWLPILLDEMESPYAEMRLEAARASGLVGHGDAVPALAELIFDEDDDVAVAAIVALSKIGGDQARQILESALEETEVDDDMFELLSDALDEMEYNQIDQALFDMFDLDNLMRQMGAPEEIEDEDGDELDD